MASATRAAYPYVALAEQYCADVIGGKIPACELTRLACVRQVDDLIQYKSKDSQFYFDRRQANRVCDIVQHFPHVRGDWARDSQRLVLQGWQCFIISTVFGWLRRENNRRRYRVAYIEVPRKNAKTTLTAAVGLYMLACDGEPGAHVVAAANAAHQARILFTDAQLMAKREPGYRTRFGVNVLAHIITQESTASRFEALSAEYSNLDGLNLHAALIDELHAHPNRKLWDVLETATGSRTQPLIWAITTAGDNRAGVCIDQRNHVVDILRKVIEDDVYFGLIYTCDPDDDPWQEISWMKANPNYGISKFPVTLQTEAKRAQTMPSMQHAFLTKHLDIWVNSASAWLPIGAWEKCLDAALELEDFADQPCYLGLDLAFRNDIAALVIAFPPTAERDWWAVFGRYYLPEETVSRGENSHYQGWEEAGWLTSTPGPATDFRYIVHDMADIHTRFQVVETAHDPAFAGPLRTLMEEEGLGQPVEIKQTALTFSPAMMELESLVLTRNVRHDGNPVLAWMMSNVRMEHSGELIKPVKDAEEKKIDGVIALLMILYRELKRRPGGQPDYENRGLWAI